MKIESLDVPPDCKGWCNSEWVKSSFILHQYDRTFSGGGYKIQNKYFLQLQHWNYASIFTQSKEAMLGASRKGFRIKLCVRKNKYQHYDKCQKVFHNSQWCSHQPVNTALIIGFWIIFYGPALIHLCKQIIMIMIIHNWFSAIWTRENVQRSSFWMRYGAGITKRPNTFSP